MRAGDLGEGDGNRDAQLALGDAEDIHGSCECDVVSAALRCHKVSYHCEKSHYFIFCEFASTTSLSAAFGLVAFATFACSTVIVAVAHVVAAGVVSAETALQSGLGVALLGSLGFCVWCNKLRRLT